MTNSIVLLHTVSPLIEVFDRLCAARLPGVRVMHLLDEPLLECVRQRGRLAAADVKRVEAHVAAAAAAGAAAVLVTCSTISPCVDEVRSRASLPVLKIDEAMVAQAVALGSTIGVIATNQTTLEPTRLLLMRQAARVGKTIDVRLVLVAHALDALRQGDGASHDRLVGTAVADLAPDVEVIVLAQATMARVLDAPGCPVVAVSVLASPHLALEQVATLLAMGGQGAAVATGRTAADG